VQRGLNIPFNRGPIVSITLFLGCSSKHNVYLRPYYGGGIIIYDRLAVPKTVDTSQKPSAVRIIDDRWIGVGTNIVSFLVRRRIGFATPGARSVFFLFLILLYRSTRENFKTLWVASNDWSRTGDDPKIILIATDP